jgi:hypothetical protein
MNRIDIHTIMLVAILVFVLLIFFGVGVVHGGPGF